jgi:hypothetical protein
MTNLLNTKTLLVIAALLATIVGLLIRQEQRSARLELQEQQRKAEQQRLEKERSDRVRKYQEEPGTSLQGMGNEIQSIDQDFYKKKPHAKK